MALPRILVQLDCDAHPSVFDAVVACDAGVDTLLSYGNVRPDNVTPLVHGAMFTRGPKELCNTAIFVGGSNVAAGESVLRAVTQCFFGPMRVSVLFDATGANTTAAAAVLAAAQHQPLRESRAIVLAGTGPVGQRAARLLAGRGCQVLVASRDVERAAAVCRQITEAIQPAHAPQPVAHADVARQLPDVEIVIAAGAAGVSLLSQATWQACPTLRILIDLNAVPPLGIEGVEVHDKGVAKPRGADGMGGEVFCYGAIGVGGTKMKIHKAAIRTLYQSNDRILDAEEVYAIGESLES